MNCSKKFTIDDFSSDKADLKRAGHTSKLDMIARLIASSHQTGPRINQVVIIGHTDKQDTERYNWGLGLRRALSAAHFLLKMLEQRHKLSSPVHIRPLTVGELYPVSNNHAKNRRVVIYLLCVAHPLPQPSAPPLIARAHDEGVQGGQSAVHTSRTPAQQVGNGSNVQGEPSVLDTLLETGNW